MKLSTLFFESLCWKLACCPSSSFFLGILKCSYVDIKCCFVFCLLRLSSTSCVAALAGSTSTTTTTRVRCWASMTSSVTSVTFTRPSAATRREPRLSLCHKVASVDLDRSSFLDCGRESVWSVPEWRLKSGEATRTAGGQKIAINTKINCMVICKTAFKDILTDTGSGGAWTYLCQH